MPWTPSDGPSRHTKKADTPKKRRQWADIANAELKKTGDDAKAIRIANGVVKNHPAKEKTNGR